MNISFRTIAAIALTTLLTACGAGQQDSQSAMTLGSAVQSDVNVAAVTGVAAAPAAASTGPAVAAASGPHNPVPDCAPEGCNSLRIIDGNAEAYRVDAMRRAAADQT
ncbi:hypothetical protein LK542_03325 [Massilia sp. IC2-477]|uniref:hypothetical protein n=1 Tax=Massilia sp. IC2-477 TaxID=2887198 RepID=UPI001D0F7E2F|nr:hypothetical protein [Massilia sp. IC2-477]MCC2954644.1 hypothetical protein [Massilia sp. IC2-477]